jgi:hypothetical protein
LHKNFDVATAREADLERDVVGDAEGGDLRLSALQHLLRFFEDRALDAPVGD